MSAPDLTKPRHTPGPWIVDSRQKDLIYIGRASEPESFLAEVWSPENEELNEVDWANARLIAAAPDLLEALRRLIEIASSTVSDGKLQQALAAVKKAEEPE